MSTSGAAAIKAFCFVTTSISTEEISGSLRMGFGFSPRPLEFERGARPLMASSRSRIESSIRSFSATGRTTRLRRRARLLSRIFCKSNVMCRGELPFKLLPVGNGRWIDDAGSFPIHKQEVVAGAGLERRFAQRDTTPGRQIELFVILNGPATRSKLRVDLTTGKLFWSWGHVSI